MPPQTTRESYGKAAVTTLTRIPPSGLQPKVYPRSQVIVSINRPRSIGLPLLAACGLVILNT